MNSKIPLIIIAFIAILFMSYPVKAESGNITVTVHTSISDSIGTDSAYRTTWDTFNVDSADYNQIEQIFIDMTGSSMAFANNAGDTTFTISSCGVGGGRATYSKASQAAIWYFTNPSSITCSPLVLAYQTNIFNDLTFTPATHTGRAAFPPSITDPVLIRATSIEGGGVPPAATSQMVANNNVGWTYSWVLDTNTTNHYNITYSAGTNQLFTTNISKTGFTTTSTKVLIQNASGTPVLYPQQGDNTFNNNNWAVTNVYGQGIALNMSLASGGNNFEIVVVNTTGSSIVTPTPASTPPPASSTTGAGLAWDKTSYNVNDIGNLTGNVTVAPPILGYFRVDITNSSNTVLKSFIWDSSPNFPQIESFFFSFPYADTFTATMFAHSPFSGDSTVATATTQAVQPQSYIFAPTEVTDGAKINITYQFNPAPTSGAIEDVILDSFGVPAYSNFINSSLCSCDTSQHILSDNINGVGNHLLRLWDTKNIKIVAQTKVIVDASGVVPVGNITSNFLALDNTQYSINDVINAQYQISSANWTKYAYFKAYLQSSGGVNMGATTLTSQTGTFQLPVSGGAFNIIQAGAAFVNMSAGNTSIDPNAVVLASVPVTVIANNNGYSVTTNPTTICLTQPEVVKYTAPFPGVASAILQVEYMTPAGTTKFTNFSFTNNGTQQFVFNNGQVDDKSGIIFNILDSNNNFQVNSIIKYQSTGCTAPGTTPTPVATTPNPINDGTRTLNNFLLFLTMPALWGVIIFGVVVVGVARNEKAAHSTPLVAFVLANILAVIGLFDPFKWYVLILTWIIAGIFFTIGRNTTTGVK